MIAILNRILADRLDTDVVMEKLDEIQSGVSSIKGELDAKKSHDEEVENRRRIAPILVPSLVPVSAGKVSVCIASKNLIPYQFQYFIVDSNDQLLGGFPISMQTIYPNSDNSLYCISKDIDLSSIPDRYIELRFDFKSLSFDELRLTGHAGRITVKYRIASDGESLSVIP